MDEKEASSEFNLLNLGKNMIINSGSRTEERNLIIIGDKQSGKTTIMEILSQKLSEKKSESYKPTCGISYNYLRAQPASIKYLLNIYEIGGNINNISLVKTLVNQNNLKSTLFLLLIDLSKTSKILENLLEWLEQLQDTLKTCVNQELLNEIKETKKSRFDNNYDAKYLTPFEIIVGFTKYDLFEKNEMERIKWICRTIRYFGHTKGFSIIFTNQKQIKLLQNQINSFAFPHTTLEQNYTMKDDIKPLFIINGKDSISEIGNPKVIGQYSPNEQWELTFKSLFKNEESNINNKETDNVEEFIKQFNEPRIDSELANFEKKFEIFKNNFNEKKNIEDKDKPKKGESRKKGNSNK